MTYEQKMRFEDFRMRYKKQIEQGMTLDTYEKSHGTAQSNLFKAVQEEVKHENELGESFLKGFLGAS